MGGRVEDTCHYPKRGKSINRKKIERYSLLTSHGMESYELEVFPDDLTLK